MIQFGGQRTLKDDIERLKNKKDPVKRKKKKLWKTLFFLLLFFIALILLRDIYSIGITVLCFKLIQCLLAMRKFCRYRDITKEQKQMEQIVQRTGEMLLIIYLIMIGFLLSAYGILVYVLQFQGLIFDLMIWFKYSFFVFLLTEWVILRFYRKFEREV